MATATTSVKDITSALNSIIIPKGLNKKRIELFIDIYQICGDQSCKNAFSSHYGHDGDYYYAQMLCLMASREAKARQAAEETKIKNMPFIWKTVNKAA